MIDIQTRARVWTLCLYALALAALTGPLAGPLAGLLTPLAQASSPALHVVAAVLAAALVGAYEVLTVLLLLAVWRVTPPRLDGHRYCVWGRWRGRACDTEAGGGHDGRRGGGRARRRG